MAESAQVGGRPGRGHTDRWPAALSIAVRWVGPMAALIVALFANGTAAAWNADRLLNGAARRGTQAVQRAGELNQLADRLRDAVPADRLLAVNDYVNRHLQFADDAVVWQQADYWASPFEALQRGAGDCEDFAMAKYFTLTAMGVPDAQLRLVYVKALIGGAPQAHMVLAYYAAPGAEPQVLDNLIDAVMPASRRTDLTPVFSFNAEGLWAGTGNQSAAGGNASARLSRWREVLQRAAEDGFFEPSRR